MSANASYFKIGLFVILGSLLIVTAIVIFGAGAIFQEYIYVESYFEDSVQGLSVGSPMKFRGVDVGQVSEIGLGPVAIVQPRGCPAAGDVIGPGDLAQVSGLALVDAEHAWFVLLGIAIEEGFGQAVVH